MPRKIETYTDIEGNNKSQIDGIDFDHLFGEEFDLQEQIEESDLHEKSKKENSESSGVEFFERKVKSEFDARELMDFDYVMDEVPVEEDLQKVDLDEN